MICPQCSSPWCGRVSCRFSGIQHRKINDAGSCDSSVSPSGHESVKRLGLPSASGTCPFDLPGQELASPINADCGVDGHAEGLSGKSGRVATESTVAWDGIATLPAGIEPGQSAPFYFLSAECGEET